MSTLTDMGFKVRAVSAANLQTVRRFVGQQLALPLFPPCLTSCRSDQECTAFGAASDSRALAGDMNAINVCYDFLLATVSNENKESLRLDSLSHSEEYFAVYNGAVIRAANPYFVFVQQIGLSGVLTDNYSPKGKPRSPS